MTPGKAAGPDAKIVVQIDPDLEDIVPGFLQNRQRDVATLDDCVEKRDWQTVRLLGHRMKGDGGGYGFDRISEIGGLLEQAAQTGDLATIRQQCAQLKEFLARVEVVYKR